MPDGLPNTPNPARAAGAPPRTQMSVFFPKEKRPHCLKEPQGWPMKVPYTLVTHHGAFSSTAASDAGQKKGGSVSEAAK